LVEGELAGKQLTTGGGNWTVTVVAGKGKKAQTPSGKEGENAKERKSFQGVLKGQNHESEVWDGEQPSLRGVLAERVGRGIRG